MRIVNSRAAGETPGIACSMESFFSSLKTERTARKTYRTRNEAKADVFDYIERFYNAIRRHSTIGYLSPVEFERKVGLANQVSINPAAAHFESAQPWQARKSRRRTLRFLSTIAS